MESSSEGVGQEEIKYVLIVSSWQPRPEGWYEKYKTYYYTFPSDPTYTASYTVDGDGYVVKVKELLSERLERNS